MTRFTKDNSVWGQSNGSFICSPVGPECIIKMAEGYASRRMFGVARWLYAKLSPLCVSWQSIKRRLEG